MEETVLIRQAQQGDRRAFSTLYGLYKERFYRYARYRLGHDSDAEDAVSECILEIWKRLPTLREPAAFPAFAFRILSACCARQVRWQIDRRTKSDLDAQGVIGDAALIHTDNTDTRLILEEASPENDNEEKLSTEFYIYDKDEIRRQTKKTGNKKSKGRNKGYGSPDSEGNGKEAKKNPEQ